MAELGYRNIYEVTGGKFTLTRFERDRVSGRKLVRETYVTGQQFTAYNYEVPAGFMDLVKVVGPAPEEKPVPPPKREVNCPRKSPQRNHRRKKKKLPK